MPHQSTTIFQSATGDQATDVNENDTLQSTQPTSNLSTSFSTSLSNNNSTDTHSSSSNNDTSDDNTIALLTSTDSPVNNQFGCRSVLNNKRIHCKTDQDYFKVLYGMYSGCDGAAKSRIQALIDNKHSTVTIRTVKPIKNSMWKSYFAAMLT